MFLVIRRNKIRPDADESTAIDFQLRISCCQALMTDSVILTVTFSLQAKAIEA